MKRCVVVFVTLLMMLSPAVPWLASARAQDDGNPADSPQAVSDPDAVRDGVAQLEADQGTGWYIVTLADPNVDPGEVADAFAAQYGLVVSHVYRYALRGFSAKVPEAALPDLRQNPLVARVVPVSVGTVTGGGGATADPQGAGPEPCAAHKQHGGKKHKGHGRSGNARRGAADTRANHGGRCQAGA